MQQNKTFYMAAFTRRSYKTLVLKTVAIEEAGLYRYVISPPLNSVTNHIYLLLHWVDYHSNKLNYFPSASHYSFGSSISILTSPPPPVPPNTVEVFFFPL
jgi:hypothetical protein